MERAGLLRSDQIERRGLLAAGSERVFVEEFGVILVLLSPSQWAPVVMMTIPVLEEVVGCLEGGCSS